MTNPINGAVDEQFLEGVKVVLGFGARNQPFIELGIVEVKIGGAFGGYCIRGISCSRTSARTYCVGGEPKESILSWYFFKLKSVPQECSTSWPRSNSSWAPTK